MGIVHIIICNPIGTKRKKNEDVVQELHLLLTNKAGGMSVGDTDVK